MKAENPSEPNALRLRGALRLDSAKELLEELRAHAKSVHHAHARSKVAIDLHEVESVDGTSLALISGHVRRLERDGHEVVIEGGEADVVAEIVRDRGERPAKNVPPKFLEQVGRSTAEAGHATLEVFGFLGNVITGIFGQLREPRTGNYRDVFRIAERAGADAVPIVLFINFLVGFVMGFQGARQLKMFGANIFVADLVGLSVTRELGPLMTAIILAGRSGSAFAAELSTMKVSEEIDALRTLGFGPFRYLVFPRALALMAVAPVLTLLADFVGMAGGLVVGITSLDLGMRGYLIETQKAVTLWDVTSGLAKSVAFAAVIALVSCQQGFSASGGAEGVGRKTTSAVVISLFALVVVDTAFTVFFRVFDL